MAKERYLDLDMRLRLNFLFVLVIFAIASCGGDEASEAGPALVVIPSGGKYRATITVTASADKPSVIRYTTDGSEPNLQSNVYANALRIEQTSELKFIAVDKFGNKSNRISETFIIDSAAPTVMALPKGGVYKPDVEVWLATTETSTVYYTLDGSSPTANSSVYGSPISISGDTVLRFMGIDSIGNESSISTEQYFIDDVFPDVDAYPAGGGYRSSVYVSLAANKAATIYYSLDGADPRVSSNTYIRPLLISQSSTLKYFAIDAVGNSTDVVPESYVIDTKAPAVSAAPSGGIYNASKSVELVTDELSTIYFTIDGSAPSTDASVYVGPVLIGATATLKYFAVDAVGNTSSVTTEQYVIDTTAATVSAFPVGGSYRTATYVSLVANESTSIYYTLDGSEPNTSSSVYSVPLYVDQPSILKFTAVDLAGNISSTKAEAYLIDSTPPVAGNNGDLEATNITNSAITVHWKKASDNTSSVSDVRYNVFFSKNSQLDSADVIEQEGISVDGYRKDIDQLTISGLEKDTSYYMNVIAMDLAGNKIHYKALSIKTALVLPIDFSGGSLGPMLFYPAIADMNNDGLLETIGTLNVAGSLVTVSPAYLGLASLFENGRVHRDARIADFNGDGFPDIVANTYSDMVSTNSAAKLFFNNGDGTFIEDQDFSKLNMTGYGETITTADFDNDGDLDVFIPYYSHHSPDEHSYLLINNGKGEFVDMSDVAGVSLREQWPPPEGAQVVDFNMDGWVDLYVAGHLFINNHDLTFTDYAAQLSLPYLMDEGIKFIDWNNNGYLDIVIHNPNLGPSIYQFDGTKFLKADVFPSNIDYIYSYGLNAFDMNNDGLEDVIVAGGVLCNSIVFLNNGERFGRSNPTAMDSWCNDSVAFGDINNDGRIDVLKNNAGSLVYLENNTVTARNSFFRIELVGSNGEINQHGRVLKIYPSAHSDVIYTRVVGGGSGYLSQNQYELLVGTPYTEAHFVQAIFAERTVVFSINPGESVRVFADGKIELIP